MNTSHKTTSAQLGITLMELVSTVVIVTLLMTVAIPSFITVIVGNRVTSANNSLLAALNLTRSEAVKRGVRVVLCPSADNKVCATGSDYEAGWLVFADADNNAAIENQNQIIRRYEPISGGIRIVGTAAVNDYISYDTDGVSKKTDGSFQAGTLAICQRKKFSCIGINRTGRVSMTRSCTCLRAS